MDGVQRRRLRIAITLSILIRLSLLLLLGRVVSPIPNGLLAEYTREAKAERIAATVYGTNLLMTLILVSVV